MTDPVTINIEEKILSRIECALMRARENVETLRHEAGETDSPDKVHRAIISMYDAEAEEIDELSLIIGGLILPF